MRVSPCRAKIPTLAIQASIVKRLVDDERLLRAALIRCSPLYPSTHRPKTNGFSAMTALAGNQPDPTTIDTMPEFEDTKPSANSTESYVPSKDASSKPRTRRRSGGFKPEIAPVSNNKMGPVDPASALKEEKLSGSAKPAPAPKKEAKAEKPAEPKAGRKPERKSGKASSTANPQPSPETLAAIQRVEARIAERQAERQARRKEREAKRAASGESKGSPKAQNKGRSPKASSGNGPRKSRSSAPKAEPTGLLGAIGKFFSGLFGSAPEPTPKSGNRGKGRSGQGKSGGRSQGNRGGGQNRGKGGQGGRGGQNRRGGKGRGGQGRRRSGGQRSKSTETKA